MSKSIIDERYKISYFEILLFFQSNLHQNNKQMIRGGLGGQISNVMSDNLMFRNIAALRWINTLIKLKSCTYIHAYKYINIVLRIPTGVININKTVFVDVVARASYRVP